MSSSNSSPIPRNYQTAWATALQHLDHLQPEKQKYFDRLTGEEQAILRKNTSPDEIIQLLATTGATKRSSLSWVNDKLAKPLSQFQGVFEATATACSGIGAPIWAPIKLVISVADEAGKIDGFLKDILDKLKLFQELEAHFKSASADSWGLLYDALTNFYVDVIDFTLITAKHYRSNTFKHLARRLWRTFDADFGEIIASMKRHLDSIPPAVQVEAIKENRRQHEHLSSMVNMGADRAETEATLSAVDRLDGRKTTVQMWLSAPGMDADLQKLQGNQLPSTCEWFFNCSIFRQWFETDSSCCLSVLGIPGCGKSVLSASLIKRFTPQASRGDSILYFFCKKGDEGRNSHSSILRTIMSQLLHHPIHGNHFVSIVHGAQSGGSPVHDSSTQDLWNLLRRMVDMLEVVYLVIDGLDECSNRDGEVVDLLAQLATLSTSNPKGIKIFTTSRPTHFQINWQSISLEESDVAGDIETYVVHRIENSKTFKLPVDRERMRLVIQGGAGGTFLWAKLMLDTLEKSSPWQIEAVLKDIPKELSDVYDLMLQRVSGLQARSVERCQKVLYWCIAACRLLTVDELLMALAISEGVSSQEEYDLRCDRTALLHLIQEECGSLITIRNDNCVQLVHTSLQEYLLQDTPQRKQSLAPKITNIDLKQIHIDLARICLRYNQFSCFELDKSRMVDFEDCYPFSRYCTMNWIFHVTESGNSYKDLSHSMLEFFSSTQAQQWILRYDQFALYERQLLVLQGRLKAWTELSQETQTGESQAGFVVIGGFILHLRTLYYERICENIEGTDSVKAFAAGALGLSYWEQGHNNKALLWYRRALAGQEASLGKEHPSCLATVGRVALVYYVQGQYDEALVWHRRALAGLEASLGKEHPSCLTTVGHIALVYYGQGQYDEALVWHRRALAGLEASLGKEHQSCLATVGRVGLVYYGQGQYDEALVWHRRALAGLEASLGKDHPSCLTTVGHIALVYYGQGQYDEALVWHRRALAGLEASIGKEHLSCLATVGNIALVYYGQGQYDEALAWHRRALAGKEASLGKEHPSCLATVGNIALVYSMQGQYDEALAWHRRALAGKEASLGKEHPSSLATVGNIALVYSMQGQYDEALAWHRRALAGKEASLGKEHPSCLATVSNIALVYYAQGQYDKALVWHRRALAGMTISLGDNHPMTVTEVKNMNVTLAQQRLESST